MKDKVSVIIPVYNVEPYIRECLDSVVGQTWKELEIIVVDDGSPDNCGAICDEYAQKYANMQVIHKKNGGVSAARNTGLQYATGEWVLFLDSDDWCHISYIEKLLTEITDNNDDVDVIVSSWKTSDKCRKPLNKEGIYEKSELAKIYQIHMFIPLPKNLHEHELFINTYGDPMPANKLYRRKILERYHLQFDEKTHGIADDNLFNLEYFGHIKTIKYVDSQGWNHRIVENSITHSFNKNLVRWKQYYLQALGKYCRAHVDANEMLESLLYFNAFFVWFGYSSQVIGQYDMSAKEKIVLVKEFSNVNEIREMFRMINWRAFPKLKHVIVFFIGKNKMYSLFYIIVKVYLKLDKYN